MSKIKEQFVSYEIALKLKELGFDEKCIGYFGSSYNLILSPLDYNKNSLPYEDYPIDQKPISAPLWQQVIDWLYCKGVFIIINMDITSMWVYQIGPGFPPMEKIIPKWITSHYVYSNPNEAREQAILKAIELIENK